MKKVLVVIPTYNERINIENLLQTILALPGELNILIVDDNSPDGTGDFVKEFIQKNSRVHLLEREGKLGLGTAYVAGFQYMLSHDFDIAVQMDADFSHDPKVIPEFLEAIEENDLVIGSRYVQGVNVINWPMKRLLLSYFANIYTKIITGMPIKDATGGFKCIRREVLESINLDDIHSNGYSFQIEVNFKTYKKGFRCKEIPIIFMDRVEGVSKMSKAIVREAITMVWKLRLKAIFGTLS